MTWEQLIEDPLVVGIAAAVLVVIVLALVVWLVVRRRRRDRLQRRFGAEYKRTVDERGSRRRAEQDLALRGEERERMEIRPLTASEREQMRARFEEIQASFVDGPESAVRFADHLLDEVAALRGYQETDNAGRIAMASVDHPEDTAVHRRRMAMLDSDQRLDTEDLRQALLAARRLFERLVREGEDGEATAPVPPSPLLGLDEDDGDDEAAGQVRGDRGADGRVDGGGDGRVDAHAAGTPRPHRRHGGSLLGLDDGTGGTSDEPADRPRDEPGDEPSRGAEPRDETNRDAGPVDVTGPTPSGHRT